MFGSLIVCRATRPPSCWQSDTGIDTHASMTVRNIVHIWGVGTRGIERHLYILLSCFLLQEALGRATTACYSYICISPVFLVLIFHSYTTMMGWLWHFLGFSLSALFLSDACIFWIPAPVHVPDTAVDLITVIGSLNLIQIMITTTYRNLFCTGLNLLLNYRFIP